MKFYTPVNLKKYTLVRQFTTRQTLTWVGTLGRMLNKCRNPSLFLDLCFFDQSLVKLFTDGSKMEKSLSVGTACVTEDLSFYNTRHLCSNSSIFTAEAMAINSALDFIANSRDTRHIIFPDSQGVLQALQTYNPSSLNHPLIVKAKNKILEITYKTKIDHPLQLVWIPSHKGIFDNELADLYDKKATRATPENILVPYTNFKLISKQLAFEKTSKSNEELGTELVAFLACECGFDFQDADHLLWDCPRY